LAKSKKKKKKIIN